MQSTYVAVLKECEPELQAWLAASNINVYKRLVIAETVTLRIGATTKSVWSSVIKMMDDKQWPYNIVFMGNETDYWPTNTMSARYDAQGNFCGSTGQSPGKQEVREVLHQMITIDPNDPRDKDRLFHAYLLRDEWENQLQFGRLHAMRKLIGGL